MDNRQLEMFEIHGRAQASRLMMDKRREITTEWLAAIESGEKRPAENEGFNKLSSILAKIWRRSNESSA